MQSKSQKAIIDTPAAASVLSGLPAIRRYIAMRDEKPIRMLGDDIHGIHAGSEFEASLCVQDLRAAVNNHDALVKALEEIINDRAIAPLLGSLKLRAQRALNSAAGLPELYSNASKRASAGAK